MDYAYLHIGTTTCGDRCPFFLPRRTIVVCHDNKIYYYKAPPKGDLNGFKGWLSSVFAHGITRKIAGRYPNYTIEEA